MPRPPEAAAEPRVPAEPPGRSAARVAAFFDVDGTLTASDVFRDLVAFLAAATPAARHRAWMLGYPFRGLLLLALDAVSRTAVNRVTASWYRGRTPDELSAFSERFQAGAGLARLHGGAVDLLAGHARAGHRIVFITGSVDLFVEPLARLLEARLPAGPAGEPAAIRVEALRLSVAGGRFTGGLAEPPLALEEKARRVRRVAAEERLDLAASHAYGDSIADLPLLDAVGRPAAVNPDRRLRRVARRRGWPVLDLPPPAPEPA